MFSSKNKDLKKFRNYILLFMTSVFLFVGFKPLFDIAPAGISREILVAGIGALFVTFITLVLLEKQTETQSQLLDKQAKDQRELLDKQAKDQADQSKNDYLYKSRADVYKASITAVQEMIKDNKLTIINMNELPFKLLNIQMLEGDKSDAATHFASVVECLNSIYEGKQQEDVMLHEEDKVRLIGVMAVFANSCRSDLGLSALPFEQVSRITSVLNQTTEVVNKVRQELEGGINEFGSRQNLTTEQQKQLAEVINWAETKMGLRVSYKPTQISLAGLTLKDTAKNVVYINTQKTDGIVMTVGDSKDRELAQELVQLLKETTFKINMKSREDQGRYCAEVRIPWDQEELAPNLESVAVAIGKVMDKFELQRYEV